MRFTLTLDGAQTCTLPPATISVERLSADGTAALVNETEFVQAADNGSNFRIDQQNCQYVYNLAASSMGLRTYRASILIGGNAVGSATFVLK